MLVLIIADDPEFAATLVARWQTERTTPEFVSLRSETALVGLPDCDFAVVGAATGLDHILGLLDKGGRPVVHIAQNAGDINAVRNHHPRVIAIRQHEGWVDCAVTLAAEVLRRSEAGARARHAEQELAAQHRYATLGRYMLDMRHSFNNALTSVLGNAELLLLEPGTLNAEARDQVATIHSMGLRMHEMLQRFSSMDLEMNLSEEGSSPARDVLVAGP